MQATSPTIRQAEMLITAGCGNVADNLTSLVGVLSNRMKLKETYGVELVTTAICCRMPNALLHLLQTVRDAHVA